jgi:hypothetical protein
VFGLPNNFLQDRINLFIKKVCSTSFSLCKQYLQDQEKQAVLLLKILYSYP